MYKRQEEDQGEGRGFLKTDVIGNGHGIEEVQEITTRSPPTKAAPVPTVNPLMVGLTPSMAKSAW